MHIEGCQIRFVKVRWIGIAAIGSLVLAFSGPTIGQGRRDVGDAAQEGIDLGLDPGPSGRSNGIVIDGMRWSAPSSQEAIARDRVIVRFKPAVTGTARLAVARSLRASLSARPSGADFDVM